MASLNEGTFQHEVRNRIEEKNLLATGQVTPATVSELIRMSSGDDYSTSAHHRDRSITVHIIRCRSWYVKFYFLDPYTMFISVHH